MERRATAKAKGTYGTLATVPYFDSINWDKTKPFGIRLPTNGRGSFKGWDYIDREDAPELFEALKKRFLEATSEWLEKGWFSQEELALCPRG